MTIGIDPIIFTLGPFEIRWYGVFITTAIVVGFAILARDAKHRGFNPQDVWMAMIWTVIGGLVGAGAGALSGSLADYGINDDFIRSLSKDIKPDTSALFLLIRKAQPEKVLAELSQYKGKLIRTSLSPDQEAKLQAAIAKSAPAGAEAAS